MSDLLLEWMSFRCAGKMDDLPAELMGESRARRVLDDFAMLGHAELQNASWRIAPPVLAGLPHRTESGATAVLCGARTPGVLSRLDTACTLAEIRVAIERVPDRPSVVTVEAPSKDALVTAAKAAGIAFQNEAAFTLLACSPTIREWPRTPCAMVAGRVETVLRFSQSRVGLSTNGWVESTLTEAAAAKAGFFRIKRDWDWVSILKTGVSECAYIDDRAGRLAAAAKLRAVSWDGRSLRLGLPSQLCPPSTIARSLALCTGALPHFDAESRRLSFAGVTPEILKLMLAITGLRLV